MGHTEIARTNLLKAKEIGERLAADPGNVSARLDLGGVLIRLGVLDVPESGLEESLAELRRGAELMKLGPYPDRPLDIIAREYAGRRLIALKRYREAAAEFAKEISASDVFLARRPSDPDARRGVTDAGAGLARAWTLAGDPARGFGLGERIMNRARAKVIQPRETADLQAAVENARRAAGR